MRKIKNFYYNLKHFFINLYKWRKILWYDRTFDYDYFLDVLEFKLNDLKNGLIYYQNSSRNEKSVEEITTALRLLKTFNEEKHGTFYWKYVKNPSTYIENNKKYLNKIKLNEDITGINDNIIGWRISMLKDQRAKQLFFKMLEYKIESWWD